MLQRDLDALAADVAEHTGVEVAIAVASGEAAGEGLPEPLRQAMGNRGDRVRGQAWARGRLALMAAAQRAGHEGCDWAGLQFPQTWCSIAHSGHMACAVVARASAETDMMGPRGIGIDFETRGRGVLRQATRFFLSARELVAAAQLDDDELVAAWTVKEACFKATPDNAGFRLIDLEVADINGSRGHVQGPAGFPIAYVRRATDAGTVAVAVAPAVEAVAVATPCSQPPAQPPAGRPVMAGSSK